jgi:D-threonate/D-erythronate kinase
MGWMPDLDCFIVADDLTGACDAAVHFTGAGPVAVMLAAGAAPPGARVVAITTESRNLSEQDAVAAIFRVAQHANAPILFKKIDSVLRGNPAAEIAAALDAFECHAAIATPAFPALGRVVDATNRAAVAQTLRSNVHVAPNAVAHAITGGARIISVDAACNRDLDAIVAAAVTSGRRILWAGSGGLAAALARHRGVSGQVPPPPACAAAPVFVIGSDHPVTLAQLARLREAHPHATVLPFGPVDLAEALVLSGGDTASAFCRAAGVRRIELYGEILPGVPWGVLRCGKFDGVPVATKSGGFGDPDALIRIQEFFQ